MKLHQKGLNDPDNHDDAVTHLELDTLKCEVKRLSMSRHYLYISENLEYMCLWNSYILQTTT